MVRMVASPRTTSSSRNGWAEVVSIHRLTGSHRSNRLVSPAVSIGAETLRRSLETRRSSRVGVPTKHHERHRLGRVSLRRHFKRRSEPDQPMDGTAQSGHLAGSACVSEGGIRRSNPADAGPRARSIPLPRHRTPPGVDLLEQPPRRRGVCHGTEPHAINLGRGRGDLPTHRLGDGEPGRRDPHRSRAHTVDTGHEIIKLAPVRGKQAWIAEYNESETRDHIKNLDGFVSTSFFRDLRSARIIEYLQWRSSDDLTTAFGDERFAEHMSVDSHYSDGEAFLFGERSTNAATADGPPDRTSTSGETASRAGAPHDEVRP